MKTNIPTTSYNHATNFFAISFIFHVTFHIEKLATALFCKGAFVIGKNRLFFGMCSSVPFAPRSPTPVDFPRKFYLSFLPLRNNVLENTQEYFWNN